MQEYDVVSVTPLGQRRLGVRFADGLSGEVKFLESRTRPPSLRSDATRDSSNGRETSILPLTPCMRPSDSMAFGFSIEIAMGQRQRMSKLTLSVDDGVVRRAKRYARARGTSVSRLVERFLSFVATEDGNAPTRKEAPILRRLRAQATSSDVMMDFNA